MGGIVWGLGMGLTEKTEIDSRTGRPLNANLADYHVPVNADIGEIDVTVVDEDFANNDEICVRHAKAPDEKKPRYF